MKFFIDSKSYFRREEKAGTFTLMVRSTNQTIHLNRASRALFEKTDEWVDLSEFIRRLGTLTVSTERLTRDYSAALFRLHACGILRLADFPKSDESGCRRAERGDYYHLAEFCRRNMDKGFSVAESLSVGYYSFYATYDRLTRNDSFTVVSLSGGEILACLMFSVSKRNFGGLVINLGSAIFHEDLGEKDCGQRLREMIRVSTRIARGTATKLRYEAIHPRQDWLLEKLLANGFKKSITLPCEISTGQDLTLYDYLLTKPVPDIDKARIIHHTSSTLGS